MLSWNDGAQGSEEGTRYPLIYPKYSIQKAQRQRESLGACEIWAPRLTPANVIAFGADATGQSQKYRVELTKGCDS